MTKYQNVEIAGQTCAVDTCRPRRHVPLGAELLSYHWTLGTYDHVVKPQMFIYINMRLVSNITAELSDVFDCEDLMMLLEGVVGMSTALNIYSSAVRYV
jgi:hypothetical protein